MKKKILVLGRRDDRPDYDTPQSMVSGLSEFNADKVEFCATNLEDLFFYYDGSQLAITDTINSRDLKDYDAMFAIGWFKTRFTEDSALSAAIYMNHYGKKLLNSEVLRTRSRSKLSQLVYASLNDIKIAKFMSINDVESLDKYYSRGSFDYPLIVKSATASKGKDNYLVQDYAGLKQAKLSMSEKLTLVQEFIPNDGDYRVIIMGDEVKMIIHRQSQDGGHLNNTSKGGLAKIVSTDSVSPDMVSQCLAISKLVGREITGVDMIQHRDTGEYYMLEINNMPQLSTGSFVNEKAKELSDFLANWA